MTHAVLDPASLFRTPNALAPHYSRFRVAERLLLTGHSHQAWPDAGFEAQQRAWLDAAEHLDDKWARAEGQAEAVRRGWRRLLDDPAGEIALGQNTHELVVRLLSALPLRERPRLVTTDGEFHTIRRQLDRVEEEGLELARVAARPVETLAERLTAAIDDRTAAVLVSSVLYETAEIVPSLDEVAAAASAAGAVLLVDAYHQLNVAPFSCRAGLRDAFVTGGGYKYCQLGEGNAFLRVPPGCELRPVLTGWFSEFARLEREPRTASRVRYGEGAARFAGATYDPTAHYRGAVVFAFHERVGLTPALARTVSQHQVELLAREIEALDLDPAVACVVALPPERRGGFLAVRAAGAARLVRRLRERDVHCDARGDYVRLGPAPYLTDDQLRDAAARFGAIVRDGVDR